jgi:diguanylate cyclase (GGDEF)-like protein
MFGRPIPGNTDLLGGDILGMHGDDRSRFATHMRELAAGKLKSTRIEVRLMREEPQGTRMIWTRFLLTSILDSHGEVSRVAGRIQDIHEEKTESLRLIGLSQTDGLTSLMNRRGFEAGVTRLLAVTEGTSKCHVLCMLDVDDFKQINDTRGHAFGDRVLVRIATLLKETFRETDLYGRLGGDEFAVFLVNFSDVRALSAKIDVLVSKLHAEQIRCSMGIACHPQDGPTFPSLYGKADEALYRVKKGGKDGYAFSG